MERIHCQINGNGLQIPLPFIEQSGFRLGMNAVIEMSEGNIRIIPALPSQEEIENRVLRLLLHRLGDAVTVHSELVEEGEPSYWNVYIGAQGTEVVFGALRYSLTGELLTDLNSEIESARQNALKFIPQE